MISARPANKAPKAPIKTRLNALIAPWLGYLPTALPLTPTEHEKWAASILEIGGFPKDNNSLKHAVAAMLMHLPERCVSKPKQYFIAAIKKSIINQVSYNVMQDIKEADKAEKDGQKAVSEASIEVVQQTSPDGV